MPEPRGFKVEKRTPREQAIATSGLSETEFDAQEAELRATIGETTIHASTVEETAKTDVLEKHPGHVDNPDDAEDDDENITPVSGPSNETGMSAGA